METDIGFTTDKGRVREKNEDSLCVVKSALSNSGKEVLLLAVADGMGGHRAGDVASRFVTDAVDKFVSELKSENSEECLLGLLGEKMADINRDLGHFANQNPEYEGMGTTLTAGIFIEKKMFLMHIGDSRCYMLRNRNLQRLSVDHSWVAQQVLAGEMNEEEAFSHRYRNILTQCLNGGPIEPLFLSESLIQDDVFLFSSDGLHGLIMDKDISVLLQKKSSSQEICDLLIHEALNHGGGDNITAIVYKLNG
ncbi:MAG: protein phosphatase 2C domain-containing protein [Candidatus Theseobacter exili]|nr:protein phosphatase 2C domain-containing protein [Candidatus Theseobacter exili]